MKYLATLVLVLLAACDDSGGGAPAKKALSPGEQMMKALEDFKDQACQCKDLVCFDKVQADTDEWFSKNLEIMMNAKPTDAQKERAKQIDVERNACKAKLAS